MFLDIRGEMSPFSECEVVAMNVNLSLVNGGERKQHCSLGMKSHHLFLFFREITTQ